MTLSTDSHRRSKFRPEIEGLRAVAALLVAVFHIWLGRVSGGVDVFFVVSSFLITTGLCAQWEKSGSIEFAAFWARLIKRLLPAALLVLFAVIAMSLVLMPKSRWKETIEEVAASAVYLQNWLLAVKSVDYLAQNSAVSPVQHFWALSVQGQFYLVWPLLFAAAGHWARRSGRDPRRTMLAFVGCVFIASLGFSIYLTARNQPLAYFNSFARVWEFSIGAAVALLIDEVRLPAIARLLLGWAGLLAILSCGVLFQVSRVFPGYAALWPTLAAVMIILAGTSGHPWGVDRLLGSRPMVYLGGLSYSLYLWHFPVLIFCRLLVLPARIGLGTGIAILGTSFVLAALTSRYVENPIRQSRIGARRPSQAFLLAGACLLPVILGLGLWTLQFHRAKSHPVATIAGDARYPGAAVFVNGMMRPANGAVPVFPDPLQVADDREQLRGPDCVQSEGDTMPRRCVIGDAGARFTLAVVGGSHSSQWLPALEDIAVTNHWRIVSFAKSNCPFYEGDSVGEKAIASCHEWNRHVLDQLSQIKPDVVFTTSTRSVDGEGAGDFVPDGYRRSWEHLAALKLRVVALRDNPDFDFDVAACVDIHGPDSALCAVPRSQVLSDPSPVASLAAAPPTVKFLDLTDYFCGHQTCPAVAGNVLIYRHMNHITASYVRTLAPMLRQQLMRAISEFQESGT